MITLERRVKALEDQPRCTHACVNVDALREELAACSINKDEKIMGLTSEVHTLKGSLVKLDTDMGVLNVAIRDISVSLAEIARNTGDIKELVGVYKNLKGGAWVLSHFGKLVVSVAAILAAWYVIAHTTLTVPK